MLVDWTQDGVLLVSDLSNSQMHSLCPVLARIYRDFWQPHQDWSSATAFFQSHGLSDWESDALLCLCLETLRRAKLIECPRYARRRLGLPPHLYPQIRSYKLCELQKPAT